MKKSLLVFALVAMMAAPAMADLTRTVSEYMSAGPLSGAVPQPRSSTVYDFTNLNGYYNQYTTTTAGVVDYWDGELCQTTETGAWLMDGFGVAWAAPFLAPQQSLYIDFFFDDGYLPWSGNYIGGYTIPVVGDGYLHTLSYDLTAAPLAMPTPDVWVVYSWDVVGTAGNPSMGPAHVGLPDPDPGAAIGTDVYEDGWIYSRSSGYGWTWYGGNPSADLYVTMSSVPEPATLALLALGAFALIRRR